MDKYAVILAGGVGSRFWPISTKDRPKQFLDILGVGKSLIRLTLERLMPVFDINNILVVTNEDYIQLVQLHLPELPKHNILGEPSAKNTAPAIAWVSEVIRSRASGNAVFAVVPSDHWIGREEKYRTILTTALDYAVNQESIVTIGIQPTRPDTGYGYIHIRKGVKEGHPTLVQSFKEKPDTQKAIEYFHSGNYLWNAGMFVWTCDTLRKGFFQHFPEILRHFEGVDVLHAEALRTCYREMPSISIDYALLEKANNIHTIPADIHWSDLGTWNSLYSFLSKDDQRNVVVGQNVHLEDVSGCMIFNQSSNHMVVKGTRDAIVVQSEDSLLVYPIGDEQSIKPRVKALGLM